MTTDFFFVQDEADFATARRMADEGYLVVPMSPAAQRGLAEAHFPAGSLADVEIRETVKEAEAEAEAMADEVVAAIDAEVPEALAYGGLDLRSAVFHGAYAYLAGEIAFARRVSAKVAEEAAGGAKVAVGRRGLLAELVSNTMRDSGVEVTPMGRAAPAGPKGGAMRTIARDLRLLTKSAPARSESSRRRVALVATGKTHPRLSSDVLKMLAEDTDIELYGSTFRPKAPAGVVPAQIGDLRAYSARTSAELRERARHYRVLSRRLSSVKAALSTELWDSTDALVATRLPVIIDRITFYAEQCLSFARTCAPDLVMMMDEKSLLGRLVPAACRAAGIPTLDMQHGVLTSEPGLRGVDYDKFCVFGESTRDILIERGVEPSAIEITGCPRFDAMAAATPKPRPEVIGRLKLDIGRPVILVATQPVKQTITPKVKEDFIVSVLEAARAVGAQLVIKQHPYEKDGIAERVAGEAKDVVITTKGNLANLISASDALVTIHSTVALEAIVIGRPVVVYRPPGMPELVPYCSEEVAEVAVDARGMREAFASVIGPGREAGETRRRQFLYRHLLLDGKAAERISDIARTLMEESRAPARDSEAAAENSEAQAGGSPDG